MAYVPNCINTSVPRSQGVPNVVSDPVPPTTGSAGEELGGENGRITGKKAKFLCSFGGKILPRPNDGALRYVGGDKRIVSIRKDASFGELAQKMFEIYGGSVVIKYQLPGEDLDALVTVICDEDIENMVDEYDKVSDGGATKIRVFLFSGSESESSSGGGGGIMDLSGIGNDTGQSYMDAVNGIGENACNSGRIVEGNMMRRKDSCISFTSTQNSDAPLADFGADIGRVEGMVSGSLLQCSTASLAPQDVSNLVSFDHNEASNTAPKITSLNLGSSDSSPIKKDPVKEESSIPGNIAGYPPHSYVDHFPDGFNNVNHGNGVGHVQYMSFQPLVHGGTPIGLIQVPQPSYPMMPANPLPDIHANMMPPTPDSLLNSMKSTTSRAESSKGGEAEKPPMTPSGQNHMPFQPTSQFPHSNVQVPNTDIYGGMYFWPVDTSSNQTYQTITLENDKDCFLCQRAIPHIAHSDSLTQDNGNGSFAETNPAFHNIQNQEIVMSHIPYKPTIPASTNDIAGQNEVVAVSSQKEASRYPNISKMQNESNESTFQRNCSFDQRLPVPVQIPVPIPGIVGFPSLHNQEVMASYTPYNVSTVASNDVAGQKKESSMIASQSESFGHFQSQTQTSKAQHDNNAIHIQGRDTFHQNIVSLPTGITGFPGDLLSLYALYPSHLPQTNYVDTSQQQMHYSQLIVGKHAATQDLPRNVEGMSQPHINTKMVDPNDQIKITGKSAASTQTEPIPESLADPLEIKDSAKSKADKNDLFWSNNDLINSTSGEASVKPVEKPLPVPSTLEVPCLNNVRTMNSNEDRVFLATEPPIPHALLHGVSNAASKISDVHRKEKNIIGNGFNPTSNLPGSNFQLPLPNFSKHNIGVESTKHPAQSDTHSTDPDPWGIIQNDQFPFLKAKKEAIGEPLFSTDYIDKNLQCVCEPSIPLPSDKGDYDRSMDVPNENSFAGLIQPVKENQIKKGMQNVLEGVLLSELNPTISHVVAPNHETHESSSTSNVSVMLNADNIALPGQKKLISQGPTLSRVTHESAVVSNIGNGPHAGSVAQSGFPVPVPVKIHEKRESPKVSNIGIDIHADNIASQTEASSDDIKIEDLKSKQPDKKNLGIQITDDFGPLQIIKNSDLEELRELGSGTFGTVYHGKWRGSDVAIKRINERCFVGKPADEDRLRADFWNEACNLAGLHHPNVVSFYGIVQDGPGEPIATVTEYMVNGSLRNALQRNFKLFDQHKRLLIAMEVAFGMEYLHGKNIVHFDLKSDNLLVNLRDPQRPICKVGDLGLSKVKCQTLISGGVRGTLPWMAPELLNGHSSLVSEKVDVFSFGIVMWELLTGDEPYADLHYGTIIGGIVNNTLRPPLPDSCDPEWRSLMEKCWSSEPCDRPSFTTIAGTLRSMALSLREKSSAA